MQIEYFFRISRKGKTRGNGRIYRATVYKRDTQAKIFFNSRQPETRRINAFQRNEKQAQNNRGKRATLSRFAIFPYEDGSQTRNSKQLHNTCNMLIRLITVRGG